MEAFWLLINSEQAKNSIFNIETQKKTLLKSSQKQLKNLQIQIVKLNIFPIRIIMEEVMKIFQEEHLILLKLKIQLIRWQILH